MHAIGTSSDMILHPNSGWDQRCPSSLHQVLLPRSNGTTLHGGARKVRVRTVVLGVSRDGRPASILDSPSLSKPEDVTMYLLNYIIIGMSLK